MSTLKLGSLAFDIEQYAIQGNAILGIKETGKSYTATMFAEKLMDAGVPVIALDPIGIWRFLRVAGKGKGYPVVVAGGEHGDLPLTPHGAPEIVRAAMKDGISLVLDLYSMKMSKADWRTIVEVSVRTLLYENKQYGLRHVFIEEAAEFAPQRVGPEYGRVYAEVEKLARMGGNAGLGYTLISQRAEEVNKAVLELCDALFLFRQKGKNSLISLGKWLDAAGAQGKETAATLPTMAQGECWVWPQGAETPIRVPKMPEKRTFHPDRRAMRSGVTTIQRTTVDVSAFVQHMSGTLEKIIAEATENDPKRLKAEVARLTRALAMVQKAPPATSALSDREVRAQIKIASDAAFASGEASGMRKVAGWFRQNVRTLKALGEAFASTIEDAQNRATLVAPAPVIERAPAPTYRPRPAPAPRANGHDKGEPLPRGERATLTALAQHPNGCARTQLTILTGYKRSSRDAYIQRLRERGLIEISGDRVLANDDGIAALGQDYEPLPTGDALLQHWLGNLPEGERRVLEVLAQAYPEAVERSAIDEATEYKRSSRDAYLQRLSARELIVAVGSGMVRAAEELFG